MEWISCSEDLPPRGKWVLVRYDRLSYSVIVKRVGWFKPKWRHKSGIVENIQPLHEWMK